MIEIQKNVPLAPYTYIHVGGQARFFAHTKTEEELREAIAWAEKHAVPITILGAGSNILVSDKGFRGLAIRMDIGGISFEEDHINIGAGVSMPRAAMQAVAHNLSGFEWAAGIPGTIGGSVYGNAGCFGGEMKDIVDSVTVFDRTNSTHYTLHTAHCAFAYRESIFKKQKNLIILGVALKLKRISDEEKKEKQALIGHMMRERVAEQAIGERTMGSTFKGIPITDESIQRITRYDERFRKPANACWVFENRVGMMSAGFLIEQTGLKERKIGGAAVSIKHANFLVTDVSATTEHVVMLIALIKERVHKMFGVMLEEEIQYIGF